MTRQRFMRVLGSGLSDETEYAGGAFPSPQPLDEETLTAEIARILQSQPPPFEPSQPGSGAAPPHWLGEEADLAMIEAYSASGKHDSINAQADEPAETEDVPGFDDPKSDPQPVFDVAMATGWVRRARRQRWRGRMRNAAGWALSITVSLALVLVVGLFVFGWPDVANHPILQKPVKAINITNSDTAPAATQPGAEAKAAARAQNGSINEPLAAMADTQGARETKPPQFIDANLTPFGR